jgi:AmpE protein
MSFLVLLLAVWVEKFSTWRQGIQQDHHWCALLNRTEANPSLQSAPWLALLVLVLLPVVLLGLLLLLLKPFAYGWLALPVHLLVLVYALGRGDILARLGPFRDAWRREDTEAAYLVAQRDLGLQAEDAPGLLRQAQGYLIWQGYQGFFAVIFWYALLGPMLALAYRLLALVDEHASQAELQQAARQLRHALDWLPVRLLAVSFALVGDFVALNRTLLQHLLDWEIPAAELVSDAGLAAAALPESQEGSIGVAGLDSLWQLLVRSAVLWYVCFAFFALFVR